MPVPWICRKCGKFAFNRSEMCIHLREEYGVDFIEDHINENTTSTHSSSDNASLSDEHILWTDA